MHKQPIKLFTHVNLIGFVITFMAGWIDTVSILLVLDERVSSMTGRFSKVGRLLSQGHISYALAIFLIISMFVLGSVLSTLITSKVGLVGGLSLSGILLIITAFTSLKTSFNLALITLPLATGSINAATTITDIGRTTHLTGAVTDFGISIAHSNWNSVVFWGLRFIAFLLGILVSFRVIDAYNQSIIGFAPILLIPAITLIVTGLVHRFVIKLKVSTAISKKTGAGIDGRRIDEPRGR